MARLLAIDTATEVLALALCGPDGDHLAVEAGGPAASARLLPRVQALWQQAGWTAADLSAIAFGQGPGAFTGLRTACAVAQGLAWALQRPVLPIDSLLLVADDAQAQCEALGEPGADHWWVAMDARMDEVYAAAYRREAGGWVREVTPALWTLPALHAHWLQAPPRAVAGTALDVHARHLPLASVALQVPREASRAAALARLARAAWAAGAARPAEQALPLYLRDKVALTTAEREAARAAPVLPAAGRPEPRA
ncbi:MAG: hypothetical protein RLY78_3947 [Pseudomonadota bacterium]